MDASLKSIRTNAPTRTNILFRQRAFQDAPRLFAMNVLRAFLRTDPFRGFLCEAPATDRINSTFTWTHFLFNQHINHV